MAGGYNIISPQHIMEFKLFVCRTPYTTGGNKSSVQLSSEEAILSLDPRQRREEERERNCTTRKREMAVRSAGSEELQLTDVERQPPVTRPMCWRDCAFSVWYFSFPAMFCSIFFLKDGVPGWFA